MSLNLSALLRRAGQPLPDRWWMSAVLIVWVAIAYVIAVLIDAVEFPVDVGRDVELAIKDAIEWIERTFNWLTTAISDVLTWFLIAFQDMLFWTPWPAFVVITGLLCWRMINFWMGLFGAGSLLLLATLGYWDATMETLGLIIVAVVLAVMIAVPLGILASQSDALDQLLRPVLDTMQTLPSFVYLVPVVALFGLGDVPAILATLVFAVPPAVRLTNLGIRELPDETLEAAESFGMTPRQMLLSVKVPLALPTIMAGINQTTLMALSMLTIAALVGAGGLGGVVYQGLGRFEHGQAVVGGFGIVFLAIIIDRLTQAFASRQQDAISSDRVAQEIARRPNPGVG